MGLHTMSAFFIRFSFYLLFIYRLTTILQSVNGCQCVNPICMQCIYRQFTYYLQAKNSFTQSVNGCQCVINGWIKITSYSHRLTVKINFQRVNCKQRIVWREQWILNLKSCSRQLEWNWAFTKSTVQSRGG